MGMPPQARLFDTWPHCVRQCYEGHAQRFCSTSSQPTSAVAALAAAARARGGGCCQTQAGKDRVAASCYTWGSNARPLKSSPQVQEDLKQIIVEGEQITEDHVVIMEQYFTFEKAYEVGYVVECGLTTGALIAIIVGPILGCCCCTALIVVLVCRKKRRKQKERNTSTNAAVATPVAVSIEMKTEARTEDI